MAENLIQVIGWAGTALIVLAYFLNSHKKIDSANPYYQLLNLLGAVGVGINVLYHGAWPALALQVVWGTIAVISLLTHYKTRNNLNT